MPMTDRRARVLLLVVGVSLLAVLLVPPIPQDATYHDFADRRALLGIPNILNVLSNVPFLVIGAWGLREAFMRVLHPVRAAWGVLFAGVLLVSAGSAWYHLSPDNASLVWDRLPMTLGFMGLMVALLSEYLDARLIRLLWPAVLAGAGSVGFWVLTDDLRFYAWVQFAPLALLALLILMYPAPYTRSGMLLVALGCYALAKVTEATDHEIFAFTGQAVSGHTLKHLLAALACAALVRMLQTRVNRPPAPVA